MYYDYHVHTAFSDDSDMPLDVACQQAIQRGIVEMAITDHLDIDYPDEDFEFNMDYITYSASIDLAKKKYSSRLSIIKGIEIGLQQHILGECRSFLQDKDFQFVIASIHSVSRKDLYRSDFFTGRDKDDTYTEYLQEVYRCIRHFEHFHVLGHIDLIRRYGDYSDSTMRYSDFNDMFDLIFKELIHTGRGLEINTSGFRYGLNSTHPDLDILKRYNEMGGEILTIGSDAHTPSHLAEYFRPACELARRAGFRYLARFPNGKPEFIKIEDI